MSRYITPPPVDTRVRVTGSIRFAGRVGTVTGHVGRRYCFVRLDGQSEEVVFFADEIEPEASNP